MFTRFNRPHQRVLALVEMPRGVPVFRRIATPDVAALEAQPQMNPRIPGSDTFFADALPCGGYPDLPEMWAFSGHAVLLYVDLGRVLTFIIRA